MQKDEKKRALVKEKMDTVLKMMVENHTDENPSVNKTFELILALQNNTIQFFLHSDLEIDECMALYKSKSVRSAEADFFGPPLSELIIDKIVDKYEEMFAKKGLDLAETADKYFLHYNIKTILQQIDKKINPQQKQRLLDLTKDLEYPPADEQTEVE
jgi:hypothetical protein